MADIRLRIEVNPDAETETLGTITNKVDSVGSNSNLSNVSFKASSSGVYTNTDNPKESGREMLSWANNGVLKFNSEGKLSTDGVVAGALASESNPDMFVWGAVPSSKQYSVKLTFSNATSLKDIVVYGDKTANQFPTKAIIDGTKTIYSDDYQWAINMEEESDNHTIEFVEWNRANYNACLTKIMVMLRYFDLDKGWIESIESLTQSTSDASSIQYGVLANSGTASIRDLDGELEDYIRDGIIPNSNVKIELIANNNKIQQHITNDTNYNTINRRCSFEMSNQLKDMDTIKLIPRGLSTDETTLYNVFRSVMRNVGYTYSQIQEMCSKTIKINPITGQPKTAQDIMNDITIKYPYITSETLSDFINKICVICQFSLCEDMNGNLYFINARPIYYNGTQIIDIPKYVQLNEPNSSLIVKNKINKIKYIENNLELNIKDICNQTFYLRDESGFSIKNIKDATIKTIGDNNYLCFFIECNSSCEYIWDVDYNNDNVYPFHYLFSNNDGSLIDGYTTGIIYNTTDTKETFDFVNSQANCTWLAKYNTLNSATFAIREPLPQNYSNITDSLSISIFVKTITKSSTKKEIGTGSSVYEFPDNEFLCLQNKIDSLNCYNTLTNNILTDYENGIKTCTLTIFCHDMYSINGQKIKNWTNGDILTIGDIVQISKDNNKNSYFTNLDNSPTMFKVTGVKFSYNGSPKLDLELQEVKQYT